MSIVPKGVQALMNDTRKWVDTDTPARSLVVDRTTTAIKLTIHDPRFEATALLSIQQAAQLRQQIDAQILALSPIPLEYSHLIAPIS
jgi:hypothetical protein